MQTKVTAIVGTLLSLIKMNCKGFFLITSLPRENSSVKGAEQFRIPSSWLVDLVINIVEVICSIVEDSGDDEGTFPSRSELVWLMLIHSEDQISFLEGSTLHISGMESTQVLLINGRSDHSHFSFFFQEVYCILPSLFCFIFGVKLDSGSVVKEITWQNGFDSINKKEWGSSSRPVRGGP